MTAHPVCPFCGVELEGFTSPEEGDAMGTFYLGEISRGNELADLLEDAYGADPPEALREWRLRHPRRADLPHPGDNPGDNRLRTDERENLE